MRHINPRRPLTDPTPAEKEEGLQKYSPGLFFLPQNYLTLDEELFGNEIWGSKVIIVSEETRLESTSLILTYWGLDLHLNIAMPSQGFVCLIFSTPFLLLLLIRFDSLASDFNYALLALILFALGAVVLILRYYAQKKQLLSMWA
jgi:hypothetical protein